MLQIFSISYRKLISSVIFAHSLNRSNTFELQHYINGMFQQVRLIGFSMHGSQFSILISLFIATYFLLSRYASSSSFRTFTFCFIPLIVLPFNGRSGIVCLLLILAFSLINSLFRILYSLSLSYSNLRLLSLGLVVFTLLFTVLSNYGSSSYFIFAYRSLIAALSSQYGDSFFTSNYNAFFIFRISHILSWLFIILISVFLSFLNKHNIAPQLSFFFSTVFPIIFLVSGLKNNIYVTPSAFMFFAAYIFTYFFILRIEYAKNPNLVKKFVDIPRYNQ